jgi:hypothetical protein
LCIECPRVEFGFYGLAGIHGRTQL